MIRPAVIGSMTSPMRPRDFEQIRRMVYDYCGVDLTGKQVLVGTRLGNRVRELGLPSFEKYFEHLRQDASGQAFTTMIDALTTNHTSFFREQQHFTLLKKVVTTQFDPAAPIRIWSAACSSGEEPYTIAFSLVEALGEAAFARASILATDISTRVLERAQRGLYPAARLQAVPLPVRRLCLLKGIGRYADTCLVKPQTRSLIRFQRFNLLEDCSTFGPFQVIFCRNVMIYFDLPTQQAVVDRLTARLAPGGYLLIGHSESLNGIRHRLRYISPATYRQQGALEETCETPRPEKGFFRKGGSR